MLGRLPFALRFARWALPLAAFGPASRRTTADLIERSAKQRSGHVFLRFEGREVTYADYNAAANRVAHWALARDLGPGDVVGLLMENRPEYLETWAGLAKAGVTTALLNTNLAGDALAHALDTAGCRVLVVGEECMESLAALPESHRPACVYLRADAACAGAQPPPARPPDLKDLDEELLGYSSANPDRYVRADLTGGDPLFFIYTSGTTGLPKAARFSHARFMGGGLYALLAGFGSRDTLYCALPLYHTVGGVMAVNAVLRAGATLALRRRFSASHFWDDIVETGATAFQYIGEFCRYLLLQPESPNERAHRVRFCVGNGLRPDVWQEFQQRFAIPRVVEFYGATESNVSLANFEGRVGSVGRITPGTQARLVRFDVASDEHVRDAAGRCVEASVGEPGELIGRISEGRTAAGRYEGYTSKEASAKKVLRDVFEPGDAWFRTGDLLRRDEDGYFFFVDRIGDTFRWKGENVSTQEVAEALGRFPAVDFASVYGVEVPDCDGRAGMAALVLHEGAAFDGAAFYTHVDQELPGYARPAFVRLQEAPELTGTFKLRKVDLQREGFDPDVIREPLYFRDDEQEAYLPLSHDVHARIRAGGVRV